MSKINLDIKCSPSREHLLLSCYTDEELKDIANQLTGNVQPTREENILLIKEYLLEADPKCVSELCWEKKYNFTKGKFIHRPVATWEDDGWLSNFDIYDVLIQYEEKYPEFQLLGIELMDFWYFKETKVTSSLSKKKFALILNLCGSLPQNKYKSHWVTIFVDLDRKPYPSIEYFDPSLFRFHNQVQHIIMLMLLYYSIKHLEGGQIQFIKNTKPLQFNDGDCGIFVIDFIVSRLKGITFEEYVSKEYPKKYIDDKRKYYFNIEDS